MEEQQETLDIVEIANDLSREIDQGAVEDQLLDVWSKSVVNLSSERKKCMGQVVSLIINQKLELRKQKESKELAVCELFLLYSYGGKYLKDFTFMLLQQSEKFLEKQIKCSQSSDWFASLDPFGRRNYIRKTKRFVYRFLHQMVNTLFATLKDSMILSFPELEGKYPYLLLLNNKSQSLKEIASRSIFAEDIFFVGCTKLGSLNSDCRPQDLISAIFHDSILSTFHQRESEKAFAAIEAFLRQQLQICSSKQAIFSLNKETRHQLLIMVEQFFDPSNQLRRYPKSNKLMEKRRIEAPLTDTIRSAILNLKRQGVSKEYFKSILENEIFSSCKDDLAAFLNRLTDSKSNEVLQCLQGPISTLSTSDNLFCGFLTLVMHAIRLLYKKEVISSNTKCHLSTSMFLRNLVGDNLIYEESLANLGIESSAISRKELSPGDLVRILCEKQVSKKILDIGLIDLSSVASYLQLQDHIGELFSSHIGDCGIYVVHFTGQNCYSGPIPFSFHYDYDRMSKSLTSFQWVKATKNWKNDLIDLCDSDSSITYDLQCFGGIYFSEKFGFYKFAFLSNTPDYQNGKYSLFSFDNTCRISSITSSLLQFHLDPSRSYRLVSLILIKKELSDNRWADPFLLSDDSLFTIPECRHQCFCFGARITAQCLNTCSDQAGWLTSEVINALVIMIDVYYGDNDRNGNILFDSYCFDMFDKNSTLTPFSDEMNNTTTVMHFPVNIKNNHWVYSFISVEKETIFFMDSLVSSITDSVEKRMVDFANTTLTKSSISWKTAFLRSPYQDDSSSCGVFTILNILRVVKAVHERQIDSVIMDPSWGEKLFTTSEKVVIRSKIVNIIHRKQTVDVLFPYLI